MRPTLVERRDSGAPVRGRAARERCAGEPAAADNHRRRPAAGLRRPALRALALRRRRRAAALKTLTLRIRYTHGFAAYVNGVEIARRRLDAGAPPDAVASDVHGPEYESFTVAARELRRGDNLLAVEVHPRTAGRDTTVELSLRGDDGARLVRGPYLAGLREREVTVVFDTDLPTAAEVSWGATRATAPPRATRSARTTSSASTGSSPARSTTIASALDGSGDLGDVAFHTPPDAGRPLRFAVYGDVRSGHDVHAALNQALADEQPDLAILTGDLVDRGSDEGDWERFFEIAGPLLRTLAIFPAIGNHEYASRGKGLVAFMQYSAGRSRSADDEPPWYRSTSARRTSSRSTPTRTSRRASSPGSTAI